MPIVIKRKEVIHSTWNPLLAGEGVLGSIDYKNGIIAMPKLNGVRGLNQNGVLVPRSLKVMRNLHTRKLFSLPALANLDGELVVGDFADEEVFVVSTSGVGAVEGTPDVFWYVFDYFHPTAPFKERLKLRDAAVGVAAHPNVLLVPWIVVHDDAEMDGYAKLCLSQGYEGIVLKDPNATYKEGRSSAKEGIFLRYCPWFTGEARILGFAEGKVNLNPSVVNELGYKKKSSHQENKVGSGRAGAFTVKDLKTGLTFNMPVPSVKLQEEVMAHPERFLEHLAHYKCKPPVKKGGKPRFPQFLGLRDPDDMS